MVDSARCLVSGDGEDGQGGVRGSLVKGWIDVAHKRLRNRSDGYRGPGRCFCADVNLLGVSHNRLIGADTNIRFVRKTEASDNSLC